MTRDIIFKIEPVFSMKSLFVIAVFEEIHVPSFCNQLSCYFFIVGFLFNLYYGIAIKRRWSRRSFSDVVNFQRLLIVE